MQSAAEPGQDFTTIVTEEWSKLPEAEHHSIDDGTVVHFGPESELPLPMPAMGQGQSRIDRLRVGWKPEPAHVQSRAHRDPGGNAHSATSPDLRCSWVIQPWAE